MQKSVLRFIGCSSMCGNTIYSVNFCEERPDVKTLALWRKKDFYFIYFGPNEKKKCLYDNTSSNIEAKRSEEEYEIGDIRAASEWEKMC